MTESNSQRKKRLVREFNEAKIQAVMQTDTLIELGIKQQDLENAGQIELVIKGN